MDTGMLLVMQPLSSPVGTRTLSKGLKSPFSKPWFSSSWAGGSIPSTHSEVLELRNDEAQP